MIREQGEMCVPCRGFLAFTNLCLVLPTCLILKGLFANQHENHSNLLFTRLEPRDYFITFGFQVLLL